MTLCLYRKNNDGKFSGIFRAFHYSNLTICSCKDDFIITNFHRPISLLSPWGLKIHQLMEISPNISLARSVQKWWIYHLYHDYVIHASSKSITKAQTTTSLIDTPSNDSNEVQCT
jgi:hypothetical protein